MNLTPWTSPPNLTRREAVSSSWAHQEGRRGHAEEAKEDEEASTLEPIPPHSAPWSRSSRLIPSVGSSRLPEGSADMTRAGPKAGLA